MHEKSLAAAVARTRIVLGAAAVIAPRAATSVLMGRPHAGGIEPALTRMAGARDLALGLGAAIALERRAPVRGWLEASALADAVDCMSALLGRRQMGRPAFIGTVAAASCASLTCLLLARRLDRLGVGNASAG